MVTSPEQIPQAAVLKGMLRACRPSVEGIEVISLRIRLTEQAGVPVKTRHPSQIDLR
jgi:hypothetical protein